MTQPSTDNAAVRLTRRGLIAVNDSRRQWAE